MVNLPLLCVEHLDVSFINDNMPQQILQDVTFTINPRETFALVGESGSGKSVTAHSILKLLSPSSVNYSDRSNIVFQGQELLHLTESQMNKIRGRKIGMIFQEPMTALNPLHTVEKQLGEVITLHRGLRGDALKKEIILQLDRVQIPNVSGKLNAYPHQLSGGQRQRVMIAMALANEPELLIADEPTTALDVTVQKQILNLLKNLQHELGIAMLLITHDLGIVRHYADNVAVMQSGRIIEQGSCDDIFLSPQTEYTRNLINSEPVGIKSTSVPAKEVLMSVRDLCVRFATNKPLLFRNTQFFTALENINIDIFRGETLGIVGESGSGKSTLALAILRLLSSTGSIRFNDQELQSVKQKLLRAFRQKAQIVFQDPFASLNPRMTVQHIIAEGLRVHTKMDKDEIESAVLKAMSDVGLDAGFLHRYPHEFSGGQRQRIAIARALILRPEIVFLDEPTSALDKSVQAQILNLLGDLQQKYQLTYVFISHDLSVIKAMSHRVAVMRAGRIIEYADTDKLFSHPDQEYTKELLSARLGRL